MLTFRKVNSITPYDVDDVRELIADVLRPCHFFVAEGADPATEHVEEVTIRWEIFRGRLLDPAHTRETATFEEWNVYWLTENKRSDAPIISVKLNQSHTKLYVVRALECYVWEGYDAGGNVIESRETTKWVCELVGSIDLEQFQGLESLRDELICQIFQCIVGTSRLPLTSVEAPLPAFTFGQLTYCYHESAAPAPMRSYHEFLTRTKDTPLSPREEAKRLETLLHVTPADHLGQLIHLSHTPLLTQLHRLFNEVSLSPWTNLTAKTIELLKALTSENAISAVDEIDFLGSRLIQTVRHLTAYDLITFHHRGANYPDALLLDLVLRRYLQLVEAHPQLFEGDEPSARRRRRALRQSYLLWRFYEGHPVPDVPTSPGENARVLPPTHARVPEEQILHAHKRKRRLFENESLTSLLTEQPQTILAQSFRDLEHPREMRELGLALFLDRPFGLGKSVGEPDQTMLLSHLAFSRSIAQQRLQFVREKLDVLSEDFGKQLSKLLDAHQVTGVPLEQIGGELRPGTVSALDAWQVAQDVLYLGTTRSSLSTFFQQYDITTLPEQFSAENLPPDQWQLVLRVATDREEPLVCIYDGAMKVRVQLKPVLDQGYARRAGQEYLQGGLQLVSVRTKDGNDLLGHNVSKEIVRILTNRDS